MEDNPQTPPATKLYIGAKLIRGTPMDEVTFLTTVKKEIIRADRTSREGYLVIYPDGYKSWSPKDTFENAYRLVTPGERELF